MLRIVAGKHQKVCCETALVADIGSGHVYGWFCWFIHLVMSFLPWFAGQMLASRPV